MDDNTAIRTQTDQDISPELEPRIIDLYSPSLDILPGDIRAKNVPDSVQTLDGEDQDAHICMGGYHTLVPRATVIPNSKCRPTEGDGQSVSWASDQDTLVDSDEERRSSRHRKRPRPLNFTNTIPASVFQPLTGGLRSLPLSRQEAFIANNAIFQNSDKTYQVEQHRGRNQHILGLKYIFERYGYPRRPALQPNTLPCYIDEVSGYHDFENTARGPPPGLTTSKGQHLVTEHSPQSYLCRFWHHRMERHSPMKWTHEGDLGRDSMRY
jgi:hypothetical protein